MENIILILIIAPTVLISYKAFNNREIFDKLKFNPYLIKENKEWYRFISHGFVHADWMHLFFNLYVLWAFGKLVMIFFNLYFGNLANLYLLGLYFPALVTSSLWSYYRHNSDYSYNAVGASGAVSAVVFASIILFPEGEMGFIFIPISLPSWIFGGLYLAYTIFMARKQMDNIGHDAHLWGAVYGIAYTLIMVPNSFESFINKIF